MRPLINLASEPFRNRRLFWILIGSVIFVATLVGLATLDSKAKLEQQLATLEPTVKRLEDKAKQSAKPDFTGSVLTLWQNEALIAAQDLITRKGFSWSQLLNDLERYVPTTVRVTRIAVEKVNAAPQPTGGNPADATANVIALSFDGVAKNSMAVTQMISDLNRSAHFAVNPKSLKPVEGTDEVEYQLQVEYRPRGAAFVPAANNTQIAAQTEGGQK